MIHWVGQIRQIVLGVVKLGFGKKGISPFCRNQSNCFGCEFPLVGLGNCHFAKHQSNCFWV
jgi:hypothetical protein